MYLDTKRPRLPLFHLMIIFSFAIVKPEVLYLPYQLLEISVLLSDGSIETIPFDQLGSIEFCGFNERTFYVKDPRSKICHDYDPPQTSLNQSDYWISGDKVQMLRTKADSSFRYTDIDITSLSFIEFEVLRRSEYPFKSKESIQDFISKNTLDCKSIDTTSLYQDSFDFLETTLTYNDLSSNQEDEENEDFEIPEGITISDECQPVYECPDPEFKIDNDTIEKQNLTDFEIPIINCTQECLDISEVKRLSEFIGFQGKYLGKKINITKDDVICNPFSLTCTDNIVAIGDKCLILPRKAKQLIEVYQNKEKDFEYKRRQIPRKETYTVSWVEMLLEILYNFGPFAAYVRRKRFLASIMYAILAAIALAIASKALNITGGNQRGLKEGFRNSDNRDDEIRTGINALEVALGKMDETMIFTLHSLTNIGMRNERQIREYESLIRKVSRLERRVSGMERLTFKAYNDFFTRSNYRPDCSDIYPLFKNFTNVQCENMDSNFRVLATNLFQEKLPFKLKDWYVMINYQNYSVHYGYEMNWDTCGIFFKAEDNKTRDEYRYYIGHTFDDTLHLLKKANISYIYVNRIYCRSPVYFDDFSERMQKMREEYPEELEENQEIVDSVIQGQLSNIVTPTIFRAESALKAFSKYMVDLGALKFIEILAFLPTLIFLKTLGTLADIATIALKIAAIPIGLIATILGFLLNGDWLIVLFIVLFGLLCVLHNFFLWKRIYKRWQKEKFVKSIIKKTEEKYKLGTRKVSRK